MYAALKRRKGFRTEFNTAAFRDLVARDAKHLFVETRDAGKIVLVIIAHLSAERCTNFFAAATEKAGVLGMTSLAIWRIMQYARSQNCRVLDVGGIDPAGNRGVYEFKRGLTRNVVQSGPLWLYGRSRVLQGLTGAYLAFR
jgi:lipid II:glycine glycyltransferase (peptidoglycan interpeptide bridge formation enzyme)